MTSESLNTHRGIALLGLASLPGENDQTSLVGPQPFNIDLLALLAQISPSVVNYDTNTSSLLSSNSSLLELSECESTALTDFPVVTDGLGTDGRAEEG